MSQSCDLLLNMLPNLSMPSIVFRLLLPEEMKIPVISNESRNQANVSLLGNAWWTPGSFTACILFNDSLFIQCPLALRGSLIERGKSSWLAILKCWKIIYLKVGRWADRQAGKQAERQASRKGWQVGWMTFNDHFIASKASAGQKSQTTIPFFAWNEFQISKREFPFCSPKSPSLTSNCWSFGVFLSSLWKVGEKYHKSRKKGAIYFPLSEFSFYPHGS